MEITVKFGYRHYIFHSRKDESKARELWAHNFGSQDDFENELEENNIDFEYDFLIGE